MSQSIKQAYHDCKEIAYLHYENFPVASIFLPAKLRDPIAAIYAFARTADNFSDEGIDAPNIRLDKLNQFEQALNKLKDNYTFSDSIFIALQDTIKKHDLPIELLIDLIKAFKQDTVKNRYQNFQEILVYCQHSANTVGRLLLHLTHQATPEHLQLSDYLCTAFQLTNFIQDLHNDLLERNRCYLALNELDKAQISIEQLVKKKHNQAIEEFIFLQLIRIKHLLRQGSPLGRKLPGLFGFEIRLMIQSINLLIHKLLNRTDIYERLVLKKYHWPSILWRAF